MRLICGVDEAGRGPLAGAVFAACVVLDPRSRSAVWPTPSSCLPSGARCLRRAIRTRALRLGRRERDGGGDRHLNILQATLLAMRRALDQLSLEPQEVLVDGLHCPQSRWPARAIVQGDAKVKAISAASILAKCARDAAMLELHAQPPEYGFDRHKGYPTPEHLEALRRHGVSQFHRRTFAPVRELLVQPPLF